MRIRRSALTGSSASASSNSPVATRVRPPRRNRRAPGRRAMAPSASVTSSARPTSSVRTVTTVTTPRCNLVTRNRSRSSDAGSHHCRSSRTTTRGVSAPARSRMAAMASNRSSWRDVTPAGKQWGVPGEQRGEHLRDLVHARDHRSYDIEPGPQRLRRPDLVRPGPDGEGAPILGDRRELAGEARLADARVALEHDELGVGRWRRRGRRAACRARGPGRRRDCRPRRPPAPGRSTADRARDRG